MCEDFELWLDQTSIQDQAYKALKTRCQNEAGLYTRKHSNYVQCMFSIYGLFMEAARKRYETQKQNNYLLLRINAIITIMYVYKCVTSDFSYFTSFDTPSPNLSG